MHVSKEFIEEIRVDRRNYRLSFFIREREICAINKTRHTEITHQNNDKGEKLNICFEKEILSEVEIQ